MATLQARIELVLASIRTAINARVKTTRTINTTAPLTGGGDLSADRTFAVSPFSSVASGIVPASGGGTTNFLRADGNWAAAGAPAGAVLSRTNDTNVTITLGGSPNTALLAATSLTVGWSGTLSVARGGTGVTTSTGTGSVVLSNAPTFTGVAVFSGTGNNTALAINDSDSSGTSVQAMVSIRGSNTEVASFGRAYTGTGGFYINNNHTDGIYFCPVTLGGSKFQMTASALRPTTDNTNTLGDGALRFSTVYAGTGTINTSDAREKTPIDPLNQNELNASIALAKEVGTFQFLDAIAEKGPNSARQHIGLTVQRAIEIMQAHNLDPFAYAFICYDEWEEIIIHPGRAAKAAVPASQGKQAEPEQAAVPFQNRAAGNRYSFRTDELLLFMARGFEARLSALEAQ